MTLRVLDRVVRRGVWPFEEGSSAFGIRTRRERPVVDFPLSDPGSAKRAGRFGNGASSEGEGEIVGRLPRRDVAGSPSVPAWSARCRDVADLMTSEALGFVTTAGVPLACASPDAPCESRMEQNQNLRVGPGRQMPRVLTTGAGSTDCSGWLN
jgi:hypothetical protein